MGEVPLYLYYHQNCHHVHPPQGSESEIFIYNLLVRIHLIIEMIWWTGLAPWEFEFLFHAALHLPSYPQGSDEGRPPHVALQVSERLTHLRVCSGLFFFLDRSLGLIELMTPGHKVKGPRRSTGPKGL